LLWSESEELSFWWSSLLPEPDRLLLPLGPCPWSPGWSSWPLQRLHGGGGWGVGGGEDGGGGGGGGAQEGPPLVDASLVFPAVRSASYWQAGTAVVSVKGPPALKLPEAVLYGVGVVVVA
jgi:hypothetical protein